MICLIVHVPLPRVQRVKQIPVNARTEISSIQLVGWGRTGETHEVYEFGNHPFKLVISEDSGIAGEAVLRRHVMAVVSPQCFNKRRTG